jgi:predicted DNA-binding transcriptional regulator AlpA
MTEGQFRLVGTHEIRVRLGGKISRQRIHKLTNRHDFPKPVAELAQGKVWLGADVDAWITAHRPTQASQPMTG